MQQPSGPGPLSDVVYMESLSWHQLIPSLNKLPGEYSVSCGTAYQTPFSSLWDLSGQPTFADPPVQCSTLLYF